MKSNMTDEELLSRGYREFKPGPFDGEYVEKMFQKRFDDDVGKKYDNFYCTNINISR